MSDSKEHTDEAVDPSGDAKADAAGKTEAEKARKMEDAQKEAAIEREEDGGYQ
ncbi:hypothetical protein [Sphingomonas solaris]|uniref:hypothetical protein n=1 Tax=Alterirhizorhabdus solaris TaxID=2529389 RepID=UPI001396C507|nr:hypothetical protein [Sphingomonas solaris]